MFNLRKEEKNKLDSEMGSADGKYEENSMINDRVPSNQNSQNNEYFGIFLDENQRVQTIVPNPVENGLRTSPAMANNSIQHLG